ncbi:HEAT repeat domain-containing protein [Enteractinococcus coprophilus]|uniref:HEAT repeat protein n=1 Tax=Enteractinococcus coprophilus TaxID=1027633 RepID=A0A543ANC3_9MICC|nr:HEAT repeat domain-containing protein [Enteractinococcus coprophilus]TQL74059.1 HEAT repeat protein [Enteractinococcus coprophilus]
MSYSASPSANRPDHFSTAVTTRVATAVETLGYPTLVDWAMRLLSQETPPNAEHDPDIKLLGGMEAIEPYMARVWAGQALLHAWHHKAEDAVVVALDDDDWQVREIAAQLVARHELKHVDKLVELLTDDAYPHVRIAAARAIGVTATPQHDVAIDRLQRLVMDPNSFLSAAAEDALGEIAKRHNRPDLATAPRY